MSHKRHNRSFVKQLDHAAVFAALGDKTRLSILAKLHGGGRFSISQLTEGSNLTRQAITKHLRVLENVGVIRGARIGRENLFEFDSRPIEKIKSYLDRVSEQWDETLSRLQAFVENEDRD